MTARTRARATDRELAVVEAVLSTGSEKAAAHRLGLSHATVKHHLAKARWKVGAATTAQLVWILARQVPRQPRAHPPGRHRPREVTGGAMDSQPGTIWGGEPAMILALVQGEPGVSRQR